MFLLFLLINGRLDINKNIPKKQNFDEFAEHMMEEQSETSSSDTSKNSEEEQNKRLMEHNVYTSNIEFGQHSVNLSDIDMDNTDTSSQNVS